jgi:integrase
MGSTSVDPLEALYVVTIFSGLRSGEILSLKWANVDLESGVISVRSSLQDSDDVGKRIIAPPKTEKSARPIALSQIAVEALKRHRKPDAKPRDLVFPNEAGKPLWRQNVLERSLYPLLRRAGLCDEAGEPLLTFHDLRHVHGTELFRAGVYPKIVQERLGHSRIGITLDTYSSSVPSMQQAAVDALDRAYPAKAKTLELHT